MTGIIAYPPPKVTGLIFIKDQKIADSNERERLAVFILKPPHVMVVISTIHEFVPKWNKEFNFTMKNTHITNFRLGNYGVIISK
jgi:hypothetical protein